MYWFSICGYDCLRVTLKVYEMHLPFYLRLEFETHIMGVNDPYKWVLLLSSPICVKFLSYLQGMNHKTTFILDLIKSFPLCFILKFVRQTTYCYGICDSLGTCCLDSFLYLDNYLVARPLWEIKLTLSLIEFYCWGFFRGKVKLK
jgi:hypothetical protein